ncbi:dihydroorotate dehydrogenase electron transfer subunit [Pyrococcus furiosus DSM 3638]|uniref:Probable dihydroorotate dehydrogenase B (NAD(+)), electron transfer subunit n=3 Tax=Pyrococcus furiosus TaxID=2261 RepID=PYRK_PYRFU|nr:dihydroorotate dehydrogenase electron transfer subunit [Pyrococcus furiosus]P58888.1 RecName: Full=Probable dihydroorotate dehydrogenase B (NAD(+)), electron transfer subunit; AltName: Full=Dihydroorotate oxidase B, electron transfer subunit [Pyrococcus furiosus DSM 3638]AAL80312.1 hydrogenase subunit gamma [Pyrococcus furiosus DSM 3638]AFN04388.1 dihydroorotate dehydrogenase electron transfer subunit [Pyrococcus furiosus COM1]QEK77914.1 dihydroorotate dehydrogenase electron transfer subunit
MLRRVSIEETWEVAKNIKAFRLSEKLEFTPGQFIMLWLPGVEEKPLSLADKNLIMVKKVGRFTNELFKLKEGDYVWIRGPYGHGFSGKGKSVALIAGGIGIPPIYALAKYGNFKRSILIYGARTKEEIALPKDIESYVDEVIITTDDGSYGIKGFPTDVLMERRSEFDYVYACGPEIMLAKILEIMEFENVEVSAERYMKCGIGVCGSCALGPYLVCRDGPVFSGKQLINTEFGKYSRTPDGRIKPL